MTDHPVVIITGSGRGIGKAAALVFAQHGYRVVILARTKKEIDETGEAVRAMGGDPLVIQADIRKLKDIQKVVRATFKKWGRIDVLVNNAAVAFCGEFEQQQPADQQEMVDTNLRGLVDFTREVFPTMRKQGSGIIINISSRSGHGGRPRYNIYSATKAAVINFTAGVAVNFQPYGIKTFCVCPRGTATKMFYQCNPTIEPDDQPEDVAQVIFDHVAHPENYRVGGHFDLE